MFGVVIVLLSIGLIAALDPIIGLVIGGLAMSILIMWSSAAEQVAVSALYIYSKTGKMPQLYQDMGVAEYSFPTPVHVGRLS